MSHLAHLKSLTSVGSCCPNADIQFKTIAEGYTPSKETAVAIALAARLTLPEARDFLSIAGYALSDSLPADIVHAACFRNHIYGREQVQALLEEFAG